MDGGAARIVIEAWTQVLAGNPPPILPPRPEEVYGKDQGKPIDLSTTVGKGYIGEEADVAPHLIRGFLLYFLYFLRILDLWLNKAEKKRLIHLPRAFVEEIHSDAMRILPQGEVVSKSDVITAWLANTAYPHSHFPHGVTYLQVFDLRGRTESVPTLAFGNAILRTLAWIDTSLGSSSVPMGALAIRKAIRRQTSPDEIGRQAALRAERGASGVLFYRIGQSQVLRGGNWVGLRMQDTDWSGASKTAVNGMEKRPAILPRCVWPIISLNGFPERNTCIMNRDREGAYWIELNLREKDWTIIENALADIDIIDTT